MSLRHRANSPSPRRHDPWYQRNVHACSHGRVLTLAMSSAAKALKPMVRNRLANMGGTSMQRQGSGSPNSKNGRGTSPGMGRPGSGNDVWSWRRQPVATKEYSEEELQRQGVHLTARLSATAGDDSHKWADVLRD